MNEWTFIHSHIHFSNIYALLVSILLGKMFITCKFQWESWGWTFQWVPRNPFSWEGRSSLTMLWLAKTFDSEHPPALEILPYPLSTEKQYPHNWFLPWLIIKLWFREVTWQQFQERRSNRNCFEVFPWDTVISFRRRDAKVALNWLTRLSFPTMSSEFFEFLACGKGRYILQQSSLTW